jgi:hypothetical protein
MIDERFSSEAFRESKLDSPQARILADQLSDAILARLHRALDAEMQRIVQELNAKGHQLKPVGEAKPGDLQFWDSNGPDTCKLRIGADVVVSTGYSHLSK